jgi:hypothetical protein
MPNDIHIGRMTMDTEYLKSTFKKMETKALVHIVYFDKGSYTEDAIKEAIDELKRRGQYKSDILATIASEVKEEIIEKKRLIQEAFSKPPSKGEIIALLTAPAILAIIQFCLPHYNHIIPNCIVVLLLIRLARKHYWKYLGIGLLINALVFITLVLLLH